MKVVSTRQWGCADPRWPMKARPAMHGITSRARTEARAGIGSVSGGISGREACGEKDLLDVSHASTRTSSAQSRKCKAAGWTPQDAGALLTGGN